ncbi:iron-sulfur cluster co-chaperone protein HscB-like [Ptychodera flava]|uniref:iron-sulfur cluster co-chaperone protein HscB-like n=1 Tax=Ptychodera flava TaxID=63121 RepID=UPI00396A3B02
MSAPMRQITRSCQTFLVFCKKSQNLVISKRFNESKRYYASIPVFSISLRDVRTHTTLYGTVNNFLKSEPTPTTARLTVSRNYCSLTRICWSCRSPVAANDQKAVYFCEKCDSILPPEDKATHFERMECEPSFDVNIPRLTQKYRELQRQLHPDRFTIRREREQYYSLQQSSATNKAYNTLLKPLSRGLYMLELKGMSIEEDDKTVDKEFLFEIMELNEEIAETHSSKELSRLHEENTGRLEKLLVELSRAFSKDDYAKAKVILTRMRYYVNIEDKIKEMLMPSFPGTANDV